MPNFFEEMSKEEIDRDRVIAALDEGLVPDPAGKDPLKMAANFGDREIFGLVLDRVIENHNDFGYDDVVFDIAEFFSNIYSQRNFSFNADGEELIRVIKSGRIDVAQFLFDEFCKNEFSDPYKDNVKYQTFVNDYFVFCAQRGDADKGDLAMLKFLCDQGDVDEPLLRRFQREGNTAVEATIREIMLDWNKDTLLEYREVRLKRLRHEMDTICIGFDEVAIDSTKEKLVILAGLLHNFEALLEVFPKVKVEVRGGEIHEQEDKILRAVIEVVGSGLEEKERASVYSSLYHLLHQVYRDGQYNSSYPTTIREAVIVEAEEVSPYNGLDTLINEFAFDDKALDMEVKHELREYFLGDKKYALYEEYVKGTAAESYEEGSAKKYESVEEFKQKMKSLPLVSTHVIARVMEERLADRSREELVSAMRHFAREEASLGARKYDNVASSSSVVSGGVRSGAGGSEDEIDVDHLFDDNTTKKNPLYRSPKSSTKSRPSGVTRLNLSVTEEQTR